MIAKVGFGFSLCAAYMCVYFRCACACVRVCVCVCVCMCVC